MNELTFTENELTQLLKSAYKDAYDEGFKDATQGIKGTLDEALNDNQMTKEKIMQEQNRTKRLQLIRENMHLFK